MVVKNGGLPQKKKTPQLASVKAPLSCSFVTFAGHLNWPSLLIYSSPSTNQLNKSKKMPSVLPGKPWPFQETSQVSGDPCWAAPGRIWNQTESATRQPYKTPLIGVITLFIICRNPPCNVKKTQGFWVQGYEIPSCFIILGSFVTRRLYQV